MLIPVPNGLSPVHLLQNLNPVFLQVKFPKELVYSQYLHSLCIESLLNFYFLSLKLYENTRLRQEHEGEGGLWLLVFSLDFATETFIIQPP